MSEHTAQLQWQRGAHETFTDQRYSRRHTLRFDGGAVLVASSSPAVVPLPMSDAAAVDPEEMFVAALSSCHMLWFLSLAAARGHVVERYEDEAVGLMARNARGRIAMTVVTLRPQVSFEPAHAPVLERQPAQCAHEGNRLNRLHRRIEPAFFGQIADRIVSTVAMIATHHDNSPRIRTKDSQDHAYCRRLARTVWPDKSIDGPIRNLQVKIGNGHFIAEGLGNVSQFDCMIRHRSASSSLSIVDDDDQAKMIKEQHGRKLIAKRDRFI